MADKTDKRTGALQSEMKIELHTHYAIGLWQGRRPEKAAEGNTTRHGIIGMPQFFNRANIINQDSLKNNPWADEAMLRLEEKLADAAAAMKNLISKVDAEIVVVN